MKRILAGAVLLLALTACDEGPKQGYVEDTWHVPSMPYMTHICMRYDRYSNCVLSVPSISYTDEEWKIYLRQPGTKPGWRDVAWSTYARCRLGSYYPDCKHRAPQISAE